MKIEQQIKPKKQPDISPVFEEALRKELDKIWENRFNISFRNLETLRRFANKKH
jgi:hypothetical protein